ncbi:unnamed protein product [Acanthoscelides obtectus]|uniref:WW domain-containing protein n=1 Tax=Acanthoscelides obtectus TaxID=200917 RepID=A0A9P0NZY9_ACAOB|nr:unnamed protein product [Acanthoscelides obtectus]CAK1654112.1 WW domain-containing adapter protein with coiled-coil homolog [Acanthoscelides obtectus]
MVMHARKTQRMNDGYFEKHQAHPYQSSKYSSSKSYGSSSDRYERIRESPNGNYRSDSPDSQSPRDRDRSYQSKSSYLQKIREKERENRDYKVARDSRDKYLDCTRSPKDKRSRESEHRSNSDRGDEKGVLHPIKVSQISSRDRKPMHNNCVDKRDDRDRVTRVGDWSEHVSSSGKKYYYNCKTEVSQWEKPREWVERERERFRSTRDRDRDSDGGRGYSSSSSRSGARHEKHSNSRGGNSSCSSSIGSSKDHGREAAATASRHWGSREDNDSAKESRSSSRKHSAEDIIQQTTHSVDMDISPGDSTPTSEVSYGGGSTSCASQQQQQQPTASSSTPDGCGTAPVLLATALPRLACHPPAAVATVVSGAGVASPNAPGPPVTCSGNGEAVLPGAVDGVTSQGVDCVGTVGPMAMEAASTMSNHHQLDGRGRLSGAALTGGGGVPTMGGSGGGGDGPPTPTHSETPDCAKAVAVPVSSPPGGLSTLQGVSSSLQALRPQGPTITPSLANHYRDDLVNHVRGWPAEVLEKQANKLAEEAHYMGSIQCAKVSAELKSARSIVRLTEIQATLQEQSTR